MKISVIIPTYNRAEIISRAIKSVQNQTFQPFEIIVVDDGSSDDTRRITKEQFSHCRYYYQENQGVSSARNLGIQKAESEWIAFLDSDDEWKPNKLISQLPLLEKSKVCHSNEIWKRNGKTIPQNKSHQKFGGLIFEQCLNKCIIAPSTVVAHKNIFYDVGLFDESIKICEDYEMWLRITAKYKVGFDPKELIIKYGGHSDQLSNAQKGIEYYHIQALEKLLNKKILIGSKFTMTKKVLIEKLKIYLHGLEKRERMDQVLKYKEKIIFWENFNE